MIGDSIISVDRESNLTIKGKHSKGTRGLWELLARKDVNSDVISESDQKKYKTILEATNAHLEGFKPGNDILMVGGPKFLKVISRLFPSRKEASIGWRINVTYTMNAKLFNDNRKPSAFSTLANLQAAIKQTEGKSVPLAKTRASLERQDAYTFNKPVRKHFPRNHCCLM